MLDPLSVAAITAVVGAVGAGMGNEAGKWAWESLGGLCRRALGREVTAPTSGAEVAAVAEQIHQALRTDPALARAWEDFARAAPGPASVGTARAVPTLPPSIRFFTDREGPMRVLRREAGRKADGRPRVALVHGPEGIGTSELAVHWGCREAARYPGGQLYADLRGASSGTAVGSAEVLRSLLRQLGMDQEEIPPGAADRREAFRRCLAGRRVLVVLDHAYSAAQVRPLLTSAPEVFTLVVARHLLPGLDAVPVPVGPLSESDARRLLTRLVGKETLAGARAVLPRVLERCGGSPFALRAAVPDLSDPHRLEEVPTVSESGPPTGSGPVRAAAERAYRTLEPTAARVYRLMAQREWPAFAAPVVAHTVGMSEGEAARHLGELADRRLLELVEADPDTDPVTTGPDGKDGEQARYRYRPSIRGHAVEAAFHEDGIAGCSAAVAGSVRWYLDFAVRARLAALPGSWGLGPRFEASARDASPYGSEGEALTALRAERGNLIEAVHAAEEFGDADSVYQLCQALWPLQLKAGHHDELLPALRAGVRVAEARHPGSRMAGRMHSLLGLDLMELRRYEEAEAELSAAAEAEKDAGHARGHASAVESLGLLRLRQWRFREAYGCFDEASGILAGIGPGDEGERDLPRAHALLERHRGRALRGLGRFTEARERLENALRYFCGCGDAYNAARSLTDLAEVALDAGDASGALPLIDRATEMLDEEKAAYHLIHLRSLRARCVNSLD
ncbi:tetratricopeptide repeat protein [Streptomyces sp. NPDC004749]